MQHIKIRFSKAIRARIIRLVIVESNDVTPSLKPITISQLEVIGCPTETINSELKSIAKPTRQHGSNYCFTIDEVLARHFAVDTMNGEIIYFCDYSMYRDKYRKMVCYSSSDGGATWTALPNYIRKIFGFSRTKGRMYLEDISGNTIFSTTDGQRLDVVHPLSLPNMLGEGWEPSLEVHGESEDMEGINWAGTTVVGGYEGIFRGGNKVVDWASCCRN